MKEFNNTFTIQFKSEAGEITHKIELSDVDKKTLAPNCWIHKFTERGRTFMAFGSIDEGGNIRTTGDVGHGRCSAFGVDAYKEPECLNRLEEIDDIDIIDCD